MCKSQSEGGQRCAAHTRPRYEAATFGTPEWDAAAAEFASTPEGHRVIEASVLVAERHGDVEREMGLKAALRRGDVMREANRATVAAVERGREWEPGQMHPSGGYDYRQSDEAGHVFYTRGDTLHRLDGPAVQLTDGAEEFWRDGEMVCSRQCLRTDTKPEHCSFYDD